MRGGVTLEFLESRRLFSGSLIPSFGTGGQVVGANFLPLAPNKLIPFGNGGAFVLSDDDVLIRLLPNGLPDTRFAGGSLDLGNNLRSFAAAPDGGVYVEVIDDSGATIQHYLKTGRLDQTFGGDGHLDLASFVPIGPHGGSIGRMVVASDGSLYCEVAIGGTDPDYTYSLYHIPADGDKSKIAGTVVANSNPDGDISYNQIIVGSTGDVYLLSNGANGVTAYNANLRLITTFGTNGVALSGQNLSEGVVDSSGRLTLIELDQTSANTPHLVRLLSNGKLDTTFGSNGSVTLPLGSAGQVDPTGRELVLEPDGSYVVSTPVQTSPNLNEGSRAGLTEYTSGGKVKTGAFGHGSDGLLTSKLGRLDGADLSISAADDGDILLSTFITQATSDGHKADNDFLEELSGT